MAILGIETSCDETSVGIVDTQQRLLGHIVLSQIDLHQVHGGVVPEIAARSHLEATNLVCRQALEQAHMTWADIEAVGVTYGAGLAGSLLMGVATAKTLAVVKNKPLYACNHVEGHVYANFITSSQLDIPTIQMAPQFPLLALIVSGKHSQLVLFENHFQYQLLGQAVDDAIGEAFDKVARLLGLGYPGGPAISKAALKGDPQRYDFPIAKLKTAYDFSFSGLKTAVLRRCQQLAGGDHTLSSLEIASRLTPQMVAGRSGPAFQATAVATVVNKTIAAWRDFRPRSAVIAGGVAANRHLRESLRDQLPIDIDYAPPTLCTDNGAMIACLASFKRQFKQPTVDPYQLTVDPCLSM